jgi:hypothetical protein
MYSLQVYGEVVVALVVRKGDATQSGRGGDSDEGESLITSLRQHCAARLAPYQAPKR